MPRVIAVIEHVIYKGQGTESDPGRNIIQYLDFSGTVLAEQFDVVADTLATDATLALRREVDEAITSYQTAVNHAREADIKLSAANETIASLKHELDEANDEIVRFRIKKFPKARKARQ